MPTADNNGATQGFLPICGGCAIECVAQPGVTLQADECAFTTYELAEDIGLAQPTVAIWGSGQTIAPSFKNRYIFAGRVVFKNCAGVAPSPPRS
jgi:hypothetical protein